MESPGWANVPMPRAVRPFAPVSKKKMADSWIQNSFPPWFPFESAGVQFWEGSQSYELASLRFGRTKGIDRSILASNYHSVLNHSRRTAHRLSNFVRPQFLAISQ